MGRYKVEFKTFKTGEWYTKTSTDNIGSAYSVAECKNYGRAFRVTDTDTGSILKEADEIPGMKEYMSDPKNF